ncbi:MAG: hypothetical protein HWE23_17050 [Rhodobacteraceae bacterium]|nr:hypothetical protein [Paracoccaceae bacterium]
MDAVTAPSSAKGVFAPTVGASGPDRSQEKLEAVNARQQQVVAEVVGRQAEFSVNRAESLQRQAEQIQNRADTKTSQDGLGQQLDISL